MKDKKILDPDLYYQLAFKIANKDKRQKNLIIELLKYSFYLGGMHAANALGVWYRDGNGIKRNTKLSIKFFKKAAAKGVHEGQLNLAYAYAKGIGIKKNLTKSKSWYLKAAKDNKKAQQYVGYCYLYGCSEFKRAPEIAIKYFRQAAKRGDLEAYYSLGYCYELGLGTHVNLKLAQKYYQIASKEGHQVSKIALRRIK